MSIQNYKMYVTVITLEMCIYWSTSQVTVKALLYSPEKRTHITPLHKELTNRDCEWGRETVQDITLASCSLLRKQNLIFHIGSSIVKIITPYSILNRQNHHQLGFLFNYLKFPITVGSSEMLTTPYTHVVALKITLFMIKLHVPIYVYGYTYKGNRQDCTLRFVEMLDSRQIIITYRRFPSVCKTGNKQ